MAATAGRPKLPANTASRANRARSLGDSRLKLQSSVFRRVRWRSGRSRGPVVSTLVRSSSRASSARGGSSLTRAAASSMASGRPSSRRQISATAPGVLLGQAEPGASACARAAKSRPRVRPAAASRGPRAEGPGAQDREFVFAAEPEHAAAGHQHHQAGGGGEQLGHERGCVGDLLEVIQDQQHAPGAQIGHQVAGDPLPEVFSPSPAAIAPGTRSADGTEARSTNRTPSAKPGRAGPAAGRARRVSPNPAGPVRVMSRALATPEPPPRLPPLHGRRSGVGGTGRAPPAASRPGRRLARRPRHPRTVRSRQRQVVLDQSLQLGGIGEALVGDAVLGLDPGEQLASRRSRSGGGDLT